MKINDLFMGSDTENKQEYYKAIKECESLAKLKLKPIKKKDIAYMEEKAERTTNYITLLDSYKGKIVERIIAYIRRNKKLHYKEVQRLIEGNYYCCARDLYCGSICGNRVVWEWTRPSYYYWNWRDFGVWFVSRRFTIYGNRRYNVEDIAKIDNSLKYCGFRVEEYWGRYTYNYLTDYITIYRKYPILEMLGKLKMETYTHNVRFLETLSSDKGFRKYLYNQKEILNKATTTEILSAYKRNISVFNYQKQKTIESFGKQLKENIDLDLDINKTYDYLHKNAISMSLYKDHINALKYLHLDLTDTKNIYPNNFMYWHDYYTSQVNTIKNQKIDTDILANVDKIKTYFGKKSKDYTFIFAKNSQELINEGEILHHCVGRMGYNQKIANGKVFIVFVREEKDKPLYTMEISSKFDKILQFYGDHDSVVDNSIWEIAKKWLSNGKRKYQQAIA